MRKATEGQTLPGDDRTEGVPGLLRDGRSVVIRRLSPDDLELVVDFSQRLSRRTISMRMLGPVVTLDRAGLARFLDFDSHRQLALVAIHDDRAVGIADFVPIENHPDRAEVTFTIVDDFQSLGLGGLLLEHIAAAARDHAISVLEADILADNTAMLRTLESSGYLVEYGTSESIMHVDIAIRPRAQVLARSDRREHQSVRISMQQIFDSRAVAVVGAGRGPDNLGRAVVKNLLTHGFPGRVYAVNPHAFAVMGLPTYPTVSAIPDPVDLVIVAVAAELVPDILRDCAAADVATVVIVSVGFGELGEQGRNAEAELVRFARAHGMRVIGPASMGILAQQDQRRLAATFAIALPPPGVVAMASQSGTLGLAVLEYARRIGLGFSSFASLGRSADVSPNDLLQWWEEDSTTSVILLDLERFGNPRKFARLTRRVSARKPIVTVTSAVHAALDGFAATQVIDRGAVVAELFSQMGVVTTRTLAEMFDVALLLAHQPVPRGDRVAVLTNATQPGALTAATSLSAGLRLAVVSDETSATLRGLVPSSESANPFDLSPRADAQRYEAALRAVLADEGVDSVIALFTPPLVHSLDDIEAALIRAGASAPEKTLVASFDGREGALSLPGIDGRSVPSYTFPEAAAAALGRATAYGAWRRQPAGVQRQPPGIEVERARAVADRIGIGEAAEAETTELLQAVGLRVTVPSDIAGPQVTISVVTDPVFGPLLAFGIVGEPVSLFGDLVFHITPVSDLDAARMVRSVRAFPLLAGTDVEAVVDAILRVAWMVEELPELAQLQLAPVAVGVAGSGLVVRGARLVFEMPRGERLHREPRVQAD
ncbi:GNAT family N-acetyltransferase [Nocardia sp. NBC_01388]|uniref:bifunctional acetate--CoA ligase family protein/GNAT family N-acetyltransferase n=1 Tax=Nocardia sp. NBC_01388 TaxID=2903596 RepID=UPI00325578E7